ncbi:MAG: metallophosphoesterase family protein [Cellulosilyticaceae bacterium]
MKILLVSDQESPYIWDYFDKSKFEDIDLMISCGDLKPQYLSFLVTMIPVPLLYIHGNHDTKYLSTPPEGCICIEDTIYTYKGLNIGGLGGSMEYAGGPFQFTEKVMTKRVKKFIKAAQKKGGLDLFISHAPSLDLGDGEDLCHRGFECFHQIYDRLEPTYHLHGHQHLNYTSKPKRILHHNGIEIINGFNYYIFEYEKGSAE